MFKTKSGNCYRFLSAPSGRNKTSLWEELFPVLQYSQTQSKSGRGMTVLRSKVLLGGCENPLGKCRLWALPPPPDGWPLHTFPVVSVNFLPGVLPVSSYTDQDMGEDQVASVVKWLAKASPQRWTSNTQRIGPWETAWSPPASWAGLRPISPSSQQNCISSCWAAGLSGHCPPHPSTCQTRLALSDACIIRNSCTAFYHSRDITNSLWLRTTQMYYLRISRVSNLAPWPKPDY